MQNAEIGLGSISSFESATRWLSGTFLATRLAQNPNHYKLDGDAAQETLEKRIEQICQRDLGLLQDANLVTASPRLSCTAFGEAMVRYYVKFETMKGFLSLPRGAKMFEIVSIPSPESRRV